MTVTNHEKRSSLGESLVKMQIITAEQLGEALTQLGGNNPHAGLGTQQQGNLAGGNFTAADNHAKLLFYVEKYWEMLHIWYPGPGSPELVCWRKRQAIRFVTGAII